MSTELYLIGIALTGLVAAVVGGLVGSHVTLSKFTSLVETLRNDKLWEQTVQALYQSVPVGVQNVLVQGEKLLNQADGLAQDIINKSTNTTAQSAASENVASDPPSTTPPATPKQVG